MMKFLVVFMMLNFLFFFDDEIFSGFYDVKFFIFFNIYNFYSVKFLIFLIDKIYSQSYGV